MKEASNIRRETVPVKPAKIAHASFQLGSNIRAVIETVMEDEIERRVSVSTARGVTKWSLMNQTSETLNIR